MENNYTYKYVDFENDGSFNVKENTIKIHMHIFT